MAPTPDDLDGFDRSHVYDDGTLARLSIRRTDDDAYPSGWRDTLHYGALTPSPETLDDGTLRRYDNAHEDTKGHELHVAPDPEPQDVEFPRDGSALRAVLGRNPEVAVRTIRRSR